MNYYISLTLFLLYALLATPGEVSANDAQPTHAPLYGFKCLFPERLSGKWSSTNPSYSLKVRINRMHIHLMGKKFRCIDKHQDLILVKEEKAGTGLTCLGMIKNTDTNTLSVQFRKYYPDPAEVRIDWRDTCRDEAGVNRRTVEFTRE